MFGGSFRTQHWYPGTFPAELPATLIQALTSRDDVVFDPYGGIGTTSIEALRLGRRSWSVEINRVAALASYVSGTVVLLRRLQPRMLDILLLALESIIDRFEGGRLFQTEALAMVPDSIDRIVGRHVDPSPDKFLDTVLCDDSPNRIALERWFHDKTLEDVMRFSGMLQEETSGIVRLLGTMCISACLRPLCSQTRSWGHIADNVYPKHFVEKRVPYGLRRWLQRFSSSIRKTAVVRENASSSKEVVKLRIDLGNWLDRDDLADSLEPSVALMLTSPPYGGAIDYVLSQRLSYYLLGADDRILHRDQLNEIGARRKRSRRDSRDLWANELSLALIRQAKLVQSRGSIVVVMPHKAEGRSNGNRVVEETLNSIGWRSELAIDRSIHTMRTRQAWTSIKRETIKIYTNERQTKENEGE